MFQLIPSDADLVAQHKKEVEDAKQYIKKLSIVSLADKDKNNTAAATAAAEKDKVDKAVRNKPTVCYKVK